MISRLKVLLWREIVVRWLKFNFVGAVGILVNLIALKILNSGLGFHYQVATVLAVETAVLHNFVWHERFTWVERCGGTRSAVLGRLLRFNLSTGLFSMLGNVVIISVLHGRFHLPLMTSAMVAIGTCALLNFLVSDHLVFRKLESERVQGD